MQRFLVLSQQLSKSKKARGIHHRSAGFLFANLWCALLIGVPSLHAQAPAVAPGNAAPSNPPTQSLTEQIIRGRVLLEAGNSQAITVLQNAAQQSLTPLTNAAGPQILSMPPENMPRSPAFGLILRQAAEAHYWWGMAADRFARRDISLTAYARAARFYAGDRSGTYSAARDALPNLRGGLMEGLPRVAPDDTLDTIATLAHGGLWKPLKLSFNLPDESFRFVPSGGLGTAQPTAQAQPLEFLITDGKLFMSPAARDVQGNLVQVPPPFRNIEENALPRVMKMSSVVMGYVRENDGPNRGLWRQVVRVHYSHSSMTAKNRDDRPRAEILALQFLKLHALVERATGLQNPYSTLVRPGENPVTTIWLSEVSALWPADEDDPAILAALGMVYMPKVNVPGSKPRENTELDISPFSRPWLAAAQSDDAPGDIVFFKVAEPRSEAEWLRQLAHEYGHVVLPPFNGFLPPLEPFGNGVLGETLAMTWIANAVEVFDTPQEDLAQARRSSGAATANATVDNSAQSAGAQLIAGEGGLRNAPAAPGNDFRLEVLNHVSLQALMALNDWNEEGPGSPLRKHQRDEGLHYLQGLNTYVERVYGAALLSEIMQSLPRIAEAPRSNEIVPGLNPTNIFALPVPFSTPPPPMQAGAFLENLAIALKNPFADGQTTLPIWLPGALLTPTTKMTAPELASRAPMGLKANERAVGWLYVPPAANALRLEWKAPANAKSLSVEGGWKSAPIASQTPGATRALRLDMAGRSGWQRFAFTPPVDISWSGAWFEKSALPALPQAPKN
ncbi:MAG TPA: hypothetical protein VGB77_21470 [Abditibacteriaceae bacterium]